MNRIVRRDKNDKLIFITGKILVSLFGQVNIQLTAELFHCSRQHHCFQRVNQLRDLLSILVLVKMSNLCSLYKKGMSILEMEELMFGIHYREDYPKTLWTGQAYRE